MHEGHEKTGSGVRLPWTIDLRPFLPASWIKDLTAAADEAPKVKKIGAGPGSLQTDNAGVDWNTMTREPLFDRVPWLKFLYEETFPILLGLTIGHGLEGDPRTPCSLLPILEPHGATLNRLTPESSLGSGLEWHRDGGDVYVDFILATNSWGQTTGGRSLVHDGENLRCYDLLTPGVALCVHAGDLPHSVEPINPRCGRKYRDTLILAWTNKQRKTWREEGTSEIYDVKA